MIVSWHTKCFIMQVGDFGILIRSGFSVPKALFFNFLSALVALGGTALVSNFFPSMMCGMNNNGAFFTYLTFHVGLDYGERSGTLFSY